MVRNHIIDKIKSGKVKISAAAPQPEPAAQRAPVLAYDDPEAYRFFGAIQEDVNVTDFTGDKFYSGFGPTNWYLTDYWTLRARSRQLFQDNLYARGIVRRYVTNIINTGLTLESNPEEALLGFNPDELVDWSETQENLFNIWAKNPKLCDYNGRLTFGQIQKTIKREAIVNGDVLVVLRVDRVTGLPKIQLIDADLVQTPTGEDTEGDRDIRHGVELNGSGEQVAYHIRQDDGITFKRIPAIGRRSGRRQAWLVYGTDKLHDNVRGEPLLSIVLQSVREIDRYRDSAQRKAVVNSVFAAFIKKGENKIGSLPVTGGATRNDQVSVQDNTSQNPSSRKYNISSYIPGAVMEELQQGEEPVLFGGQGTDINFPIFEEAIVSAMAWALEIPPEILKLAFSNNYSASQAALNEFKIFLNSERTRDGEQVNQPVYVEWFISSALTGAVEAPGFLDAWRDPRQYVTFGAWVSADWAGAIKPTTDILKQAKGYELMINLGAITRDRASKEMTGTKFSKNVKKLRRENEELATAQESLMPETEPQQPQTDPTALAEAIYEVFVARAEEEQQN